MKKNKKTKKLERFIIKSTIVLLIVFSLLVVIIGYNRFSTSFTKEYYSFSTRIANTAKNMVNADNIDNYIQKNGQDDEYNNTLNNLRNLTNNMEMSVIYVIKPDSDFKHYTSVFNAVSSNSGYTEWKIGERKNTTNQEYEEKYKELYEGKINIAKIVRVKNLNGAPPHITVLVPLKNNNGEVVSILCVQRVMKGLTRARHTYVIYVTILTFILIIITFIFALTFLRRQIVKPILQINDEAIRFTNEKELKSYELSNISRISEVESLAESINKMENDITTYVSNLTTITKEKERIQTELHLASSIQISSLPNDFTIYKDKEEFDLYASMTPAKEVGGDFYDFYLIDDDHLALVIADVSGKGIPAALFMMATKILISENLLANKSPKEVLNVVNNRIIGRNISNMFVTVWIGILELSTGKLVAANAGHEYPVIYRKNKEYEILKDKHCVVVGAVEDYEYQEYEIKLDKGDKIFIYTDGLVEAMNDKQELFGLERMKKSLNNLTKENAEDTLNKVQEDVNLFVGDAMQFDDLTMLMVEYRGSKKVNSHEEKI